jgi:SAM-dependent methyltransferase
MNDLQDIINKNKEHWDNEVESGKHYTIPDLDLDADLLKKFAIGELLGWDEKNGRINNPLLKKIRQFEYSDIKGKKVLCLASGGGQQSAMFSLLGADVTVADISQGQLNADITAANHYGYTVKTVQCSMTDLSVFEDDSFDIVHQPISICFVPDVSLVYKEVFRVLKKGGLYHVDHINPATHPVSYENDIDGWDGIGFRISSPYIGGPLRIDENGKENMTCGEADGEFRHLFIDIFCKLTETGFQIKYIWEDERNLVTALNPPSAIKPCDGSYDSSFSIVQRYINVLSIK